MKRLVFITSNKGKVTEAAVRLAPLGYTVEQNDLGYPEVQADSLQEVALFGVEHVRTRMRSAFFLEDSGLFISSLAGFPGVYSKYVFLTIGLRGVLQLMEEKPDRSAVFRSVIAYSAPGQDPELFVGECPGTLAFNPRGTGGFGYDPVFIPTGEQRTFAEMTTEEKTKISHRGRALALFVRELAPA